MKPVDVKLRIYIDFDKESNDKDPKFKVDHLRILKCKNTFARSYVPNWSGEVSMIKKKSKILFREHILLVILTMRKLLEPFSNKNCKR